MKIIYWNIRGVGNMETQIYLYHMIKIHKPDFLFLSEPMVSFNSIPPWYWHKLNLHNHWKLRARWFNCMKYCRSITCSCVHIHREGNMVADALAKNGQGLSLNSTQWWPAPPPFINSILLRDSLGLPYNRLMMT